MTATPAPAADAEPLRALMKDTDDAQLTATARWLKTAAILHAYHGFIAELGRCDR
jgi:hypothetical protein